MDEFVHVTVPRIVDEQSGAVTRKLQKARETFDIENAKIAKRERKVRRTKTLVCCPHDRSMESEAGKTDKGRENGMFLVPFQAARSPSGGRDPHP